ncbi:Hypothetical_protein [Hexamita inflata]|uniref:Hypothetical_protein n=1 Tax=Hexamita inflata TaxID=28002 RepID=A0ABP1JIP6_9EUKA
MNLSTLHYLQKQTLDKALVGAPSSTCRAVLRPLQSMIACRFIEKKLFGAKNHLGYYQIENNCISAFYLEKDQKVDLFYNLADLEVEATTYGKSILYDPRRKLKIVVNLPDQNKAEMDSLQNNHQEDSDKIVSFCANGCLSYEESGLEPTTSFTRGGQIWCFDQ